MGKAIYLVTGAAGFLGSHVCDELLERGDKVRALVLPGDKSVKYVPEAVEIVEGNLCDVDSLETFFTVPEGDESVVIHCASMVTTNAEFNQKLIDVNVGGTRNIIDKCLEHQECRKLVYVSSTGAIPEEPKGTPIKETRHFTPVDEERQVGCYSQSKAMATQAVLDACDCKGLKACVVHPSGILGPKDYAVGETTGTIIKIMKGEMQIGMGGSFNLCDVRDLAHGCVAAADKGRIGECYILGNKEVTLKEVCQMLHDASGCKRPLFYVPISMAYVLAAQMEKKAQKTGEKPLMTNFAVYNLARNNTFDYSKAEEELGYHTRPYAETLRDEAEWLVREGLVEGTLQKAGQTASQQAMKEVLEDKGLIQSAAVVTSKEELRKMLREHGITVSDEAVLEDGYHGTVVSRNWNRLSEVFRTKDFLGCKAKLEEYGLSTTPAEFDLINDVIGAATDEVMGKEMDLTEGLACAVQILQQHGYYHITEEFVLTLLEYAALLEEERLFTERQYQEMESLDFWERCAGTINLLCAVSTIAALRFGIDRAYDMPYLIAIAGGLNLVRKRTLHNG